VVLTWLDFKDIGCAMESKIPYLIHGLPNELDCLIITAFVKVTTIWKYN